MLASYSKILEACKIDASYFGTDINCMAIELTKKMFELNNCDIKLNLTEANLLDGLKDTFDVIIFNPVSI